MKKLTKYCSYIAGVSRAISGKQRAEMTGERRDDIRVKHGIMFSLASLLLLSLLPGRALAAIDCTKNYSGRTTYVDYQVPFLPGSGIQVSALRNSPVGTILWSQFIGSPERARLGVSGCTRTDQTEATLNYVYNMEGNLPAIVGTWHDLNVHDTGIPGIGLVISGGAAGQYSSFPYVFPYTLPASSSGGGVNTSSVDLAVQIYLIKTGEIPAGTWSIPISVPAVTLHSEMQNNLSGPEASRDYGARLILETASINVISGTCQTPDVNVAMGRHNVSPELEDTPWVDFAIELNNCPPMFGFYGGNIYFPWPTASWEGSDKITMPTLTPNTLSVLFNPVYGFSEMPNGEACANISPVTDAASGVCLEIQDKLNIGVLDKGAYGLAVDSGLNLLNSVANYSIPLRARYVRTAGSATMTAGRADSAVEFTINYY